MLRNQERNSEPLPSPKPEYLTRILIYERNPNYSVVLHNYLTVFGYKAERHSDFEETLRALATEKFDILIMGDEQPDMHPLEALRRLKQVRPELLLLVVGARGDDQLAVDLFKAGADDYVSRHVKDKNLLVALPLIIERLLQKKILLGATRNLPAQSDHASRPLVAASSEQTESLRAEDIQKGSVGGEIAQSHRLYQSFKHLIRQMAEACLLVDAGLHVRQVNQALVRLLGVSAEALIDKSIRHFIPVADFRMLNQTLTSGCNGMQPAAIELSLTLGSGRTKMVRCHYQVACKKPHLYFWVRVEDIEPELEVRAEETCNLIWQNLLSSYSSRFINLSVRHFDAEICELLGQAGGWLNFYQASIYLIDEKAGAANCYLHWQDERYLMKERPAKRINIHSAASDLRKLQHKKVVSLASLFPENQLGVDGGYYPLRQLYRACPSDAVYIAPIVSSRDLCGWISFQLNPGDESRSGKSEQYEELADLVASAVIRRRYEEVRRITHLRLIETHGKLSEQACLDGLTNLANRRYFDRIMEAEVRRAARDKSCMSLVFLDIDYFKDYNDTYGHIAGDHCLKNISNILASHFQRAGDFVARYGGEEFAIILPGLDCWQAVEATEVLRQKVEQANILHNKSPLGRITISGGVACWIAPTVKDIEALMKKSDSALYKAKNSGRNRVVVFE